MIIPRRLHQTWRSPVLPPHLADLSDAWRALLPDWGYRLWTDADNRMLAESLGSEVLARYDGFAHGIERSDLARYLILFEHGGIYVDLDYLPLRSIEPLLEGHSCVLPLEPDAAEAIHDADLIISNAFMACTPRHPFIRHLIDSIVRAPGKPSQSATAILHSTGPFAVTRAWRSFEAQETVTLIDSPYLCPMSYQDVDRWLAASQSHRFRRLTSSAFAVHLFAGSWWRRNQAPRALMGQARAALHPPAHVRSPIPRILHVTWKSTSIPSHYDVLLAKMTRLHPGWSVRVWTDEAMARFISEDVELARAYRAYPTMIQRCDLFRLFVVHRCGGMYLDLDIDLHTSFEALPPEAEAVFFCEKRLGPDHGHRPARRIANYAFGAMPGHPLLGQLLERAVIDPTRPIHGPQDVLSTTGPGMVTEVVHQYLTKYPDASVWVLHPPLDAIHHCRCATFAGTVACQVGGFGRHLHKGSWRGSLPITAPLSEASLRAALPADYGTLTCTPPRFPPPRVGIVIPVFGRADIVERCLRSLAQSDLTGCIVCIVDETNAAAPKPRAGFVRFEGADSVGHDLECRQEPLAALLARAADDPRCVAVNDCGWLKSALDPTPNLHPYSRFSLYVKAEYISTHPTKVARYLELPAFEADTAASLVVDGFALSSCPLIKIVKCAHGNVHDSLQAGLDLLHAHCEFLMVLDSDTIHHPSWVSRIIAMHRAREAERPGVPVLSTGFHTTAHATIAFHADHRLKSDIGGIQLCMRASVYRRYVRGTLTTLAWDYTTCAAISSAGGVIACTRPSVIQHIGNRGLWSRPGTMDVAADFDDGRAIALSGSH